MQTAETLWRHHHRSQVGCHHGHRPHKQTEPYDIEINTLQAVLSSS